MRKWTALLLVACALPAHLFGQSATRIPAWPVQPTPALSIGEDGTEATEFTAVASVVRTATGLIAVVNAGSNEIRVFDARGSHVGSLGRSGAGPGEFRWMVPAGLAGDTLFIWDVQLRRISAVQIDRTPRLVREVKFNAPDARRYGVAGRASNGEWFASTTTSTPGWGAGSGILPTQGYIGLVPANGEGKVNWIAEVPGATFLQSVPSGDMRGARSGAIAFSGWHHGVASGEYLWFGSSSSDSLVRYDPRNGERAVFRLPFQKREPDRATVGRLRDAELKNAKQKTDSLYILTKYESKNMAKHLPYFGRLLAGPDGELWVEGYTAQPKDPVRYVVVGPDLTIRATVDLPAGTRMHSAGRDYILGVRVDADGVQTVHMFTLTRTARS